MLKVLATGTFEIIHPGHIYYLESAAQLGDELTVIIARDSNKKRKPIIPEEQRKKVVESLKPVDRAILGSKNDMFKPVRKLKPDVLALGADQKWDPTELEKKMKIENIDVDVRRISEYKDCKYCSSSKIIKKILDEHS